MYNHSRFPFLHYPLCLGFASMTANIKGITLTEESWLLQVRGEWRIVECWSSAVRLEDYVDSWSVYIFSSKRRLVIVLFPKTQVGNQWLCLKFIFDFVHSIMRLQSDRFFSLVSVFLLYAIRSFYLSNVGNWCQYRGCTSFWCRYWWVQGKDSMSVSRLSMCQFVGWLCLSMCKWPSVYSWAWHLH